MNFGAYATQVAGWDALLRDAQRLGLAPEGQAATPPEKARGAEGLLLERSLEPPVLYPFPIALLALLGLGMRGRGGNVARSQRAIGLLLPVALALYLFYGAYSYRELRFLLPLQALLLVCASRAFASSRKSLRPATLALAGLALLSAAADIAAASRPMQSTSPYGRTNEETLALRWIDRSIEANAIIAVRTHTALVERELLFHQTDRRWVPIGRDEHQLRIEALGLEDGARPRKDLDGAQRAFLAEYRPHAIDLDQTVIDLMELRAELLAGRPLQDDVREAALALLLRLPQGALGDDARSAFAAVLVRAELTPTELGLAVFFLARSAVLDSFARDLVKLGALLERMPERPAYLSDLYLFEYVLEEAELRQMLLTGEVAAYGPDGTRGTRALAPQWKGLELVGEWPRPGFAPQASNGRFALYRLKRA
ncbi:MAG: hypothetical protein IPN34_09010 [Planctomycetes bacterium]|nr:hypothetical protein [Planctomycetota bacterium]